MLRSLRWVRIRGAAGFVLGILVAAASAGADERLVHTHRSAYNTIYVTDTASGIRVMRFEPDGARQSAVKPGDPEHLELPYSKVMPVTLALVERPQSVLIIGLGGGTLPMFFRKHDPTLEIDVVEIDPDVLTVAKSHFGFREDAQLRVHVDEGRHYIENTNRRYDMIMIDAFGVEPSFYGLATREFHHAVRRALTPAGVVLGNIWGPNSNPLYASMLKTYQASYDSTALIEIENSGNRIVIGGPRTMVSNKAELMTRARKLTKALVLRDDLAKLIEYGWRPIGADSGRGRVLLDAERSR